MNKRTEKHHLYIYIVHLNKKKIQKKILNLHFDVLNHYFLCVDVNGKLIKSTSFSYLN